MRHGRRQRGYTLIEVMVSIGLSLLVTLALGQVVTTSTKMWIANREKVRVQGNTTLVANWIRQDVQRAAALEVSGTGFRTYDRLGALRHEYALAADGSGNRLRRDGVDLVPAVVSRFDLGTNADTTNVGLDLELMDLAGSRTNATITVALRDHTEWF